MPRRKTQEECIADFKKAHGHKYDYTKVKYVNNRTKVKIICRNHGPFMQTPASHLNSKCGCNLCAIDNIHNTNRERLKTLFLQRAHEKFGDKFDYTKVKYINWRTKVTFICKDHGEFRTTPQTHLDSSKGGCRKCYTPYNKKTKKEFIKESKAIYGDRFDYSKVIYKDAATKVIFICKKHNKEFKQTPSSHLNSLDSCPTCVNEKKREDRIYSKQDFLDSLSPEKRKRFDYSDMVYNGNKKDITVRCLLHGKITTKAYDHRSAESGGCTQCQYEVLGLYKSRSWSYSEWEMHSKDSKNFTGFKIYIVKMKENNGFEFFKIGKTYTSVKKRTSYFPYNVEIIDTLRFDQARETCEFETDLQNKCKKNSYIPKKEFAGKYECFSSIDPILPLIE